MREKCKRVPLRMPKNLGAHTDLLRALADPHRLRIVATLARADDDGCVCVCDLNDDLALTQPTVSHHLKLLRDAGVVTSERRGTWVYYRLAEGLQSRIAALLDAIVPQKTAAAGAQAPRRIAI